MNRSNRPLRYVFLVRMTVTVSIVIYVLDFMHTGKSDSS